ncbi:hypothetical protein NE237_019107 [Protea cynaroides]|uniref:Uncharacterized protein n=1 Tax=Protea cynaroides TaxID=273540 RepID=A0A9Q0QPN4_9MAGN|nr:hypothetical protein NE237_019107 [Protea cynaroides]
MSAMGRICEEKQFESKSQREREQRRNQAKKLVSTGVGRRREEEEGRNSRLETSRELIFEQLDVDVSYTIEDFMAAPAYGTVAVLDVHAEEDEHNVSCEYSYCVFL